MHQFLGKTGCDIDAARGFFMAFALDEVLITNSDMAACGR